LELARDACGHAWQPQQDLLTLADSLPQTFGIEVNHRTAEVSKSEDGESPPDRDVFVNDPNAEELIEVKSGAISKGDRVVFWRRLHRELAQNDRDYRHLVLASVLDQPKALASTLTLIAGASAGRAISIRQVVSILLQLLSKSELP
jgi:hypothetical protein